MMNGRLWQWLRSSLANGHAAIASLLGLHTTWIMPANVIETHILMNELIVYDCCQSQARHLYYWMDSYKLALGVEVHATVAKVELVSFLLFVYTPIRWLCKTQANIVL
jgi:hypothetical protein